MKEKDRELEIKKLEVEKAKVLEGIIRTLVWAIIPLGTAAGAILYQMYDNAILNPIFLTIISTLIIVIGIILLKTYLRLQRIIKELERWKQ